MRSHVPPVFWLGLVLMLLAAGLDLLSGPLLERPYIRQKVKEIQHELWRKEKMADALLREVRQAEGNPITHYDHWLEHSERTGIHLYLFEGDQLRFWSSRMVTPLHAIPDSALILQQLENGSYLQKNIWHGNRLWVTLIPVQLSYAIDNRYLQDRFLVGRPGKISFDLSMGEGSGSFPIYNLEDEFLFSIKPATWVGRIAGTAWLFSIGIILLLWGTRVVVARLVLDERSKAALGWFLGVLSFVVGIWQLHVFPESLFRSELFNPSHFATSRLLRSLGDLLALTILLGWGLWTLSSFTERLSFKVLIGGWLGTLLLLSGGLVRTVQGLVMDSNISFRLNNLYSISGFTVLSLMMIFCWLWMVLYAATQAVRILKRPQVREDFWSGIIGIAVALGAMYLLGVLSAQAILFASLSLLALWGWHPSVRPWQQLRHPAAYILMSLLFLSVLLSSYDEVRIREQQRAIATRLTSEHDAIAEYLYKELHANISNDPSVRSYFTNPLLGHALLEKRISEVYFTGYFDKYDVKIKTYTVDGMPFKMSDIRPEEAFLKQEAADRIPVWDNNLYFVQGYGGLPAYLGHMQITTEGQPIGVLLLYFQLKTIYEESVYPELLLADAVQYYRMLDEYSYAIYNQRRLVTQRGEFAYPDANNYTLYGEGDYATWTEGGYVHLLHQVSPEVAVVVSHERYSLLSSVAVYAFMLFLALLFVLLIYGIHLFVLGMQGISGRRPRRRSRFRFAFNDLPFRTKVLGSILAAMTLALVLIGAVTIRYIVYVYENDEEAKLKQKTRLLAAQVEARLRKEALPANELQAMVKTLSAQQEADINLFDVQGNLRASTQWAIYEEGIVAPRMSPEAYVAYHESYPSLIIRDEDIGNLHYTASYMPLRDAEGRLFGFINVPFFTKEKELNEQLSSFVVALVDLYILLFFILVVIGVFISSALTAPLNIIRQHLRATSLGRNNTPIVWRHNDEIGKLVKEYNSMIVALQENAARLAQSEREGAWKEMAKQVAHEIKNPLTPMKLNIQRLQRAWNEGQTDELEVLIPRVSALLIRQIDTLSQIATEFSAFAKMPVGKPEEVQVQEMLRQAAMLFRQQATAEIELHMPDEALYVTIDPGHFSRVLNNLIKNALQAIPDNRKGIIQITAERREGKIFIQVKDNGTGITPEVKERIFTPNFSTKSSGMGLGLAIVRNIIEKAGGEIGFETVVDKGTTFWFSLPGV